MHRGRTHGVLEGSMQGGGMSAGGGGRDTIHEILQYPISFSCCTYFKNVDTYKGKGH